MARISSSVKTQDEASKLESNRGSKSAPACHPQAAINVIRGFAGLRVGSTVDTDLHMHMHMHAAATVSVNPPSKRRAASDME